MKAKKAKDPRVTQYTFMVTMHIFLALDKVGGTTVESSEIQRMNEAGEIHKNLVNPTLRDTVQVTGGGVCSLEIPC